MKSPVEITKEATFSRRRLLARALATAVGAGLLVGCGRGRTAPRVEPGPAAKSTARRVIVIGAGLAGLQAALDLEAAGAEVTLIEARDRVGGRVKTLREFADGLHAEAGATTVVGAHTRVRELAARFGLRLESWSASAAAAIPRRFIRGTFIEDTAAGLRGMRDGAIAPLPVTLESAEQAGGLARLFENYVYSFARDLPVDVGDLDAMSFADFLKSRGASPGAIELLALGHWGETGDGIAATSALSILREARFLAASREGPFHFVDGADVLPLAMVGALRGEVRTKSPLQRIVISADEVLVEHEGGQARADVAICTLPLTVLRDLDIDPPLPPAMRAAMLAIPYASVTRVSVQTRTRFWESFGKEATVHTDLDIGTVLEASKGQSLTAASAAPRRGLLQTYSAGESARRLAVLDDAALRKLCLEQMEQVFTGATANAEKFVRNTWDDDQYARGAYAWFRPGQLGLHLENLKTPHGRLHFAGEHLSSAPGWMEGALESGALAAKAAQMA